MADTLYERDFHAWALQQAEALRSGDPIDVANVAEELEGLGKSQQTYLVNNLAILLAHMLKWRHQPGKRTRSWLLTIAEHRDRVGDHLDQNPSLRPLLPMLIARACKYARKQAARETGLKLKRFSPECEFTWEQLMQPLPEEAEE